MMDGIVAIFRRAAPLMFLAAVGCGSADASSGSAGSAGGAGGWNGSTADPSGRLAFVDSDLLLVPGQTKEIGVRVSGVEDALVRFVLVGDSRDAFLDDDEVRPSAGIARVMLTAPSQAATFVVRASLETGEQAELPVSTGEGFSSLIVVPKYEATEMGWSGRTVDEWVATVRTGHLCNTYSEIPPPDGDRKATSTGAESPKVEGVPAAAPLTVTLRAGKYLGGCANVSGLIADEVNTVQVRVVDRPLQMGNAAFDLRLGIQEAPEWRIGFAGVVESMLTTLVGDSTSDVSLVLDWMALDAEQNNADLHAAITVQRTSADFDTLATEALGPGADVRLQEEFRKALLGGLTLLPTEASIVGTLEASAEGPLETATVNLLSVGGAEASVSGFPASISVSWLAGANDMVQIGGAFDWVPQRLLVSLAETQAAADTVDLTRGLAERFGCGTLATALTEGGTDGFAYLTCDAPCVKAACETAVRQLWDALDAAPSEPSRLEIAASGAARIDNEAVPVGFDGEWVACVSSGADCPRWFEGTAEGTESTAPIPK